ncbi:MAG: hypothetical protein R2728_04045 [Chitinophagales bacterium]
MVFINGNNTPRIARIDLTTFETVEIIELPNSGGNHTTIYNGKYGICSSRTRFSVPTLKKIWPLMSTKVI